MPNRPFPRASSPMMCSREVNTTFPIATIPFFVDRLADHCKDFRTHFSVGHDQVRISLALVTAPLISVKAYRAASGTDSAPSIFPSGLRDLAHVFPLELMAFDKLAGLKVIHRRHEACVNERRGGLEADATTAGTVEHKPEHDRHIGLLSRSATTPSVGLTLSGYRCCCWISAQDFSFLAVCSGAKARVWRAYAEFAAAVAVAG
jgi:hypothetical protein